MAKTVDPSAIQQIFERAVALQRRGEHKAAADAYRTLAPTLASLPAHAASAILINLARALRHADQGWDALASASDAAERTPDDADAWDEVGLCLQAVGEPERAIDAHARSIRQHDRAHVWIHLGNAQRDTGRLDEAIRSFRHALDKDDSLAARFNLATAIYDESKPEPSLTLLDACLDAAPEHDWALFLREVFRRRGAKPQPHLPPFLASSLAFVDAQPEARLFADTFRTLDFALSVAPFDGLAGAIPGNGPASIIVELGVRRGTSLRYLAAKAPGRRIVGFDSFEGLPEAWGDQPPGLYTALGELPDVPPNVELVKGWFDDTLPTFAAALTEKIALLHVDCDIYSSARVGLATLGPHLQRGAVVVFDDYLGNPGWEQDEHRALHEVITELGVQITYLAFSPFSRQAVVRWGA